MYAFADKYDINGLKILAISKFKSECSRPYTVQDIFSAAYIAYTTTPEHDVGMRNVVVDSLYKNKEWLKNSEIMDQLRELPIGFDLFLRSEKEVQL